MIETWNDNLCDSQIVDFSRQFLVWSKDQICFLELDEIA